mmetsp:Transcript_94962/g.271508  ORF Transcript_94962/g.271508 Transcript_94962/m.271508 type:complete len:205 (-) Transcript_94962:717-1331(-)
MAMGGGHGDGWGRWRRRWRRWWRPARRAPRHAVRPAARPPPCLDRPRHPLVDQMARLLPRAVGGGLGPHHVEALRPARPVGLRPAGGQGRVCGADPHLAGRPPAYRRGGAAVPHHGRAVRQGARAGGGGAGARGGAGLRGRDAARGDAPDDLREGLAVQHAPAVHVESDTQHRRPARPRRGTQRARRRRRRRHLLHGPAFGLVR